MNYSKQYDRVMANYVTRNKKLSPSAASQSLYDSTFMVHYGRFLRLAQKFGLLKEIEHLLKLEASLQVLAMTTDELVDALKYFAAISYTLEVGKPPDISSATLSKWHQAAETVFSPFKVNIKKPLAQISKILSNPNSRMLDKKGEPLLAYETLYDQTKAIRTALYPKKAKIFADPAANANLRLFLGNVLTYFNSKSEPSFKAITQNVRHLSDPKLSNIMHVSDKEIDNTPVTKFKEWIAKKTTRMNPDFLTPEESKNLSVQDQEIHKELRKHHNKAYKDKLQDIVRKSGNETVPAIAVKNQLHSEGFPHFSIPKGFKGRVDEKGALYTSNGKPLATGQSGGIMEMNPDYNPSTDDAFYCKGRSSFATGKGWQYFYTLDYERKHRQGKKTAKVAELGEKMEDMQKAWRKDLKQNKENKMQAAMLEAMYQTQARIGSGRGKTAGETTYGLSTWLNKHVKVGSGGNIIITYPGKKGMINKHVIKPDTPETKELSKYIQELKHDKRPNDPIWSDYKKTMNAGDVRKYLRELGFSGGAHKFRTHKGTELFKELLDKKPLRKKNPTPKEVDQYHKMLTTEVGKILGHQRTKADGTTVNVGSTAAKSYIDIPSQIKLFRDKHVPVPKWLERVENTDSEED
ncbi:MAG: hypothetical protein KGH75_03140 [Rhodospirillales bacterium]|nr:hypothetical protein [Rhodospirillales bacterium]